MVIPVESSSLSDRRDSGQDLVLVTRLDGRGDEVRYSMANLEPVRFMPMKHALH